MPTPPADTKSPSDELNSADTSQPENSSQSIPSSAQPVTEFFSPTRTLPWWQRWLRGGLWAGAFIGTATMTALGGTLLGMWVPLPLQTEQNASHSAGLGDLWQAGFRYQVTRPVNILVMGIDEVPGAEEGDEAVFSGRTDTLLLVRIDPETSAVSVLSIPRDTRISIPEHGIDKINQANVEGGPELVAQTISANFGYIPIDRYVRVSTSAFTEIVDLVDGVEVFVPKRMEYEDRSQDLYINLYPGLQTLDGNQAEQFARFRKDANGDIGRVQRQQMLLKALRNRFSDPAVIPRLPQAMRILQQRIDTNLSWEEMLALANFGLNLQASDFHMVMLPGRFSSAQEYIASYWIPDRDASTKVMETYFQADTIATLADNREATPLRRMRIAVQNAASSPDIATEVARHLRDKGFYNVYVIQDWPATQEQTDIIAQRGNLESAQTLKSMLGVGQAVAESTGDLESDLTLRVGNDWLDIDSPTASEASSQ